MARRLSPPAAALAIATLLTAGCVGQSSVTAESGIRIGNETLEQFKAGVTTEAWLVAILDKPTSWAWVDGVENTKVFRYATEEETPRFLFGSGKRNVSVVYFIITDGVVTRFWADRATQRTLLGNEVPKPSGEKSG